MSFREEQEGLIKRFSIRLPKDLYERVRQERQLSEESMNQIIKKAIIKYLEEE